MSENSKTFIKDPQAIMDYTIDWGAYWLGSDTLLDSDWTVPSGLSKVSDSFTDDIATVFISGGVVGNTYQLINHITTALGRQDERSIYLIVDDK